MLDRLVRLVTRRARVFVAVAVLLGVASAGFGASVAGRLHQYDATDPASQSARADVLLARAHARGVGVDVVALVATPHGARSESGRARIAEVRTMLRADSAVGSVVSFAPGMVARDGRSAIVEAAFRPGTDQDAASGRLLDRFAHQPGVRLGGIAIANWQVNHEVSQDLRRAELYAAPLLFLLALVIFRSAVAALLPLLVGGLAIVCTMAALRIAAMFGTVSVFALNTVTGLGLGLAIDYSLFIVSRYREELARGATGAEAIKRVLATAGRTVMFSSVTVAAALGALLVFPQNFLYSMGIGGMIVAVLAAAAALLVLPPVLALLGPRVNALAPARLQRARAAEAVPLEHGFWYRLARAVMRRPVPVAIAAAGAMLALGTPLLSIHFTQVDATVLPKSASARQVQDALQRGYDTRLTAPVTIVARATPAQLENYLARVRTLPGVASSSPPRTVAPRLSIAEVVLRSGALSNRAQRTVKAIRALHTQHAVLSRGQTASFIDLQHSLGDHLPLALALLAATTIVILFLMTGSLVLPVKAVIMNLLTLSAALGSLVLIFQHGNLQGLLAYQGPSRLASTQLIFLAAVAFGLSTDYGVFLLARIKEAHDAGATRGHDVATGLERTGRIITAAALLFCIAVGAFATSHIVFIKQLGIGTALAVLLDATLVRALLVPALMRLLGERNWWAPTPLHNSSAASSHTTHYRPLPHPAPNRQREPGARGNAGTPASVQRRPAGQPTAGTRPCALASGHLSRVSHLRSRRTVHPDRHCALVSMGRPSHRQPARSRSRPLRSYLTSARA